MKVYRPMLPPIYTDEDEHLNAKPAEVTTTELPEGYMAGDPLPRTEVLANPAQRELVKGHDAHIPTIEEAAAAAEAEATADIHVDPSAAQ